MSAEHAILRPTAMDLRYKPLGDDPRLPVEVLQRSDLLRRVAGWSVSGHHRAQFHQLVICTSGSGVYRLDYEDLDVRPGVVLRMYPGQVHRFSLQPSFDGPVLRWPPELDTRAPGVPRWHPAGGAGNRFEPDGPTLDRLLASVESLRQTQLTYDGSPRYDALLRSMLSATILRFEIDSPSSSVDHVLPEPYVAFRELLEDELHRRPSAADLAFRLGYSVKTLDRASKVAAGQTAKQVVDHRIALEVKRLLTHSDIPIATISADMHFPDQSTFARYVKRLLGSTPSEIRRQATAPPEWTPAN